MKWSEVHLNNEMGCTYHSTKSPPTFNNEFCGALGGASLVGRGALVGTAILFESFGDFQRNTLVFERDLEICIIRDVVPSLEPFNAWLRFTYNGKQFILTFFFYKLRIVGKESEPCKNKTIVICPSYVYGKINSKTLSKLYGIVGIAVKHNR